jgi:hypothetical protein
VQNEKNKNEKRIFCHIFFDFVRKGGAGELGRESPDFKK